MKIAVICANGKAGQLIVKEAVERGLDITAVVREENKSAAKKVIAKDLFDLTAGDSRALTLLLTHSALGRPTLCRSIPHLSSTFAIF